MVTVTIERRDGRAVVLRPRRAAVTAAWLAAWGLGSITGWGWYWGAWLFGGLVIPDLFVVAAHIPNASASAAVWRLEGLNRAHPFDLAAWHPAHWIIAVLLWGSLAWLSVHLPFGL